MKLTQDQIFQGKSLLKQVTNSETLVAKDRFALGRWAVEVCGPAVMGRPSEKSGNRPTIAEAAEAIGYTATDTLAEYRQVATRWGSARTQGLSWSALRFLTSECETAEAREGLRLKAVREFNVEVPTVNQLRQAAGKSPEQNGRDAIEQARQEAATKATAEAEAKAEAKAKAEQEALTRKHREEMLAERQRTEREQKAQAERIRQEEQAKAAENARREIEALRAQLTKAAEKAEFDVSTLTEKQKAEVMTLLANDPEQAREWFSAQNKERARKLQEETQKSKDAADRRRNQMADRERREAEKRASKEYEDSALYFYLEEVMPIVEELRHRVSRKPVTLEHVIRSGRTAQDIVNRTETMEDVAVTVREAVFLANAAAELEGRSR